LTTVAFSENGKPSHKVSGKTLEVSATLDNAGILYAVTDGGSEMAETEETGTATDEEATGEEAATDAETATGEEAATDAETATGEEAATDAETATGEDTATAEDTASPAEETASPADAATRMRFLDFTLR